MTKSQLALLLVIIAVIVAVVVTIWVRNNKEDMDFIPPVTEERSQPDEYKTWDDLCLEDPQFCLKG